MITSLYELKERESCKGVQYCRWIKDFLTANGEDIPDVFFLAMGRGSIYLGASTPKTSACYRRLIRMRLWRYTTAWSKGWCMVRDVTESYNWSHILWVYYQLWTLLKTDSVSIHWPLQQDGATAHTDHGSCIHDAYALCVPWKTNFKGHLAISVAWNQSLRFLSVGSNGSFSLQRQSP
jgi:hypothetical protein